MKYQKKKIRDYTAPVPCDTKSLLDEALKTDPKVERRQGDVAKILINLYKTKKNAKKIKYEENQYQRNESLK